VSNVSRPKLHIWFINVTHFFTLNQEAIVSMVRTNLYGVLLRTKSKSVLFIVVNEGVAGVVPSSSQPFLSAHFLCGDNCYHALDVGDFCSYPGRFYLYAVCDNNMKNIGL
jgi:hypothetical protein